MDGVINTDFSAMLVVVKVMILNGVDCNNQTFFSEYRFSYSWQTNPF